MESNEIATLVAKLNAQFDKVATVEFKVSDDLEKYDIDIVATKCRFAGAQCSGAQYNLIDILQNVYKRSNSVVRNTSKACASAIITASKANPDCIFRVV